MQESGQLKFIEKTTPDFCAQSELGFGIFFADGHTEKMMIPMIQWKGKTLCFMADLLPTAGHIPLPYVMGYDTRPLLTLPEKEKFLTLAAQNDWLLFLEHDAHNPIITVQETEKGVRLNQVYTLQDILNS